MVLPISYKPRVYLADETKYYETIPSISTVPFNKFATFPFLKLPPELRNKIYDLVFPGSRVLIIGNHPQKELKQWNQLAPAYRGPKPRYRLTCRLIADQDSQSTPVPLDMLEVCRTINDEATAFLYSRTEFQFDSIKTINKFLNTASKTGIQNITSLDISQECYGEPYYTKHCQWKSLADEKWSILCTRIARELTSLQHLKLYLTLTTWPVQLKTTASWTRPLMTLRGSGLHRVDIVLHHHMFSENRLMMTAHSLENLMMTVKGREERDLAEALEAVRELERKEAEKQAERAKRPAVRATKALVIKIDPPQVLDEKDNKLKKSKAGKKQITAGPTYYQSKGLEKYSRVDLKTVGVCFL